MLSDVNIDYHNFDSDSIGDTFGASQSVSGILFGGNIAIGIGDRFYVVSVSIISDISREYR